MITTELQYFPCIGQFAYIFSEGSVFFDSLALFKRSTFRNRMVVSGSNGPVQLSIPILGGRNVRLPYGKVKIDYKKDWQRDHFRTLESVYGKSPFFFHYKENLQALFAETPVFLFEWNLRCLDWLMDKVKLHQYFKYSCTLQKDSVNLYTDISDYFLPSNYNTQGKGPFLYYAQVFEDRVGFLPNLSVLDLIFSMGPETGKKIHDLVDKPY